MVNYKAEGRTRATMGDNIPTPQSSGSCCIIRPHANASFNIGSTVIRQTTGVLGNPEDRNNDNAQTGGGTGSCSTSFFLILLAVLVLLTVFAVLALLVVIIIFVASKIEWSTCRGKMQYFDQ